MNTLRLCLSKCLLFCCLLLLVDPLSAKQIPVIRHDPFQRPQLKLNVKDKLSNRNSKKHHTWAPILNSTLRAGSRSMVIVNGKVIKLGEAIEGYKLIRVGERSATFLKNRKKMRLTLDDYD